MGIYDYLNTNNNQTADLSYNASAKNLIDSLISGNITNTPSRFGNIINGFGAHRMGDNQYNIFVPDPQSSGYFTIHAQLDPNTNKATNLGSTYGSNATDTSWYAPLAVGAAMLAPEIIPALGDILGGTSVASGATGLTPAEMATLQATSAPIDSAMASTVPSTLEQISSTFSSLPTPIQGALTSAGANVGINAVTGNPITPQGVIASAGAGALGNIGGIATDIGTSLGLEAGAGATSVGTSILNATTSGVMASLTGGDVGKAIATGAVSGAIAPNALDVATTIVGGGDPIAGITTLSNIADSTGLTTKQVSQLVSNAVTTGVVSASQGNVDPLKAIETNLAGTLGQDVAQNIVQSIDPTAINSVVQGVGQVANVATKAAITGQDIPTAIQNVAPAIISSAVAQNIPNPLSTVSKTVADNTSPLSTLSSAELNAINTPFDTTQYPTYAPLASTGVSSDVAPSSPLVPQGTVSIGSPDTPTVTPTVSSNVSPKDQYQSLINQGMDANLASEMAQYSPPAEQPSVDLTQNIIDQYQPTRQTSVVQPPLSANQPINQSVAPLSNVSINQSIPSTTTVDLSPLNNQVAQLNQTVTSNYNTLSPAQQNQVNQLVSSGVADMNTAINAVQSGLANTNENVTNLQGSINNLGTNVGTLQSGLGNLQTGLGNLSTTVNQNQNTTNQDIAKVQDTIAQNQDVTNQALSQLTDAQKAQVASQVAMGSTLNNAIQKVQSNVTQMQNQAQNTAKYNTLSTLANQKTPAVVNYMHHLNPSFLTTGNAPTKNPDILGKLKEIYPQLSQVSPQLLARLGYEPSSPLESQVEPQPYRSGGMAHVPEFITGHTGHYASGKGDGQSDDIKALLNEGDYVIDAEAVAQLGNGSSKAGKEVLERFRGSIPHQPHAEGGKVPAMIADGEYVLPAPFVTALGKGDSNKGAKLLDSMRTALREHKRSAPLSKIPPKSKSPLEYLRDGHKMKESR